MDGLLIVDKPGLVEAVQIQNAEQADPHAAAPPAAEQPVGRWECVRVWYIASDSDLSTTPIKITGKFQETRPENPSE